MKLRQGCDGQDVGQRGPLEEDGGRGEGEQERSRSGKDNAPFQKERAPAPAFKNSSQPFKKFMQKVTNKMIYA